MARGGPTAVCPVGSWLQGVGPRARCYPWAATPGQTSQLRPCRRCFVLWLARGDQWITSPTCPKKYTVHEAKDVTKNRPPLASFHATLVKSHIGPTHPCFRILLPRLTFLPRPGPVLRDFSRHRSAIFVPLSATGPVTSYLFTSSPVLATLSPVASLCQRCLEHTFANLCDFFFGYKRYIKSPREYFEIL